MTPEQIAEKMKAEIQQGFALSQPTLIDLKKYFDQLKNNQVMANTRPTEILAYKEKVIGYMLTSLIKNQHSPKDKILILQILERDLISTKHNVQLFNKLYVYLIQQDQNVAIQASKAIDALIKQINEGQQATANPTVLDTKQHYLKLFEFLKEKTQFLLKLSQHVKEPDFKVYRRQNYEQKDKDKNQRDKDKQKKDIVFKNSRSLKFINQVPHLFIHLMAYVDITNRPQEDDNKIKELIRKSIDNIIQSLRKTPYEQFYNQFNYDFNNELFGVMTKLLQFLFINLRSDKEQSGSANKSNINLKKHIADQIQYIKVPEVIKNFIYLLKNCSEDFQLNRYEIVNRLKLLLNNLDKGKLSKPDAIEIMNEILNQETIFGRKKILGDYSKNAICSYWIQMIRSPVLLSNIFLNNILSVRALQQSNISEDSPEITSCFLNIEKLIEEILKTMFDNTLYPSVQEKCIELITYLIEHLFPEGADNNENPIVVSNLIPASRKIQQHKLKILLRILDCASLKLMSIRHIFEEIDSYITKKLGHKITKKQLPQPLKLQHMQLNSLNISIAENSDWAHDAIEFIQSQSDEIDSSLLTVSVVQNKFITIYEEQDELCFNSHPVKLNNYTLYMKEVKTKLLEKCITLAHKITKTFLSQNIEVYNQMEMSSLKAIYFIVSNKRALNAEQCRVLSTILKNGLKIFEILHSYDLHSDDQTNKKGHLKNFMLIFAQIYDPVNFRDIFQPNMNEFFKNLINYAKNCADYCLQFVLIEPYCSNNNQSQPFNKNIVQLLTYNLILRLQSTSDQLDPFHEFYSYKQQYFLLLQKLIRFPFRCLSRYSDESFIRNYFRQIILFLTKKAHNSRFCLDYLHLMRTLFKNILFNSSRQAASPLFTEFYAICCRNAQTMQGQNNSHSIFINVNILDNFLRFYETGIPELADIVTELIIMLPLKSKHIIQFAKQGYIVKPLLHCLCLMSDYNYLLRTLKTFEIIITHSSSEEINIFLQGVKDKLINRLFQMVVGEFKSNDLKPEKINNDLSSLSLKLLAKLGALSRNRDPPINMQSKSLNSKKQPDFEIIFRSMKDNKVLTLPIENCIEYSIEIFHKLLDSYYQSIIFISMEMIEKNFDLLLTILPLTLQKMSPLAQKIINVFAAILALSSKYLTISLTILNRIRQQVKNQIKGYVQQLKKQLRLNGFTQQCRFFLKILLSNLNQRVLITREQNFVKEISQQPKKFLWTLIITLVDQTKGLPVHNEVIEYLIKSLMSSVVMLKNPHQIKLNIYQHDYNHILPFKNAALGALNEILDKTPNIIMEEIYPDVLQSIFISLNAIPDILNLKIMKHPKTIAKKIYKYILRDQQIFLEQFKTQKSSRVFACILENLVGYSIEAHEIAADFLNIIMNETSLSLPELLYSGTCWDDICDQGQGKSQSKFNLSDFSSWKQNKRPENYPIISLMRSLLRIAHNVNEQSLKNNPNILKLLHNCFATYQIMITLKWKDKQYQAFQMLNIPKEESDEAIGFNEMFKKIITVGMQIINFNYKNYQNFTKIIIEQGQATQQSQTQPPNRSQPPGHSATGPTNLPRRDGQSQGTQNANQVPVPPPPAANNQSFNINTNTFIDDEQYGLNIEDLDMQIKIWGRVISSILKFLKSMLLNQTVFGASKNIMRKKADKTKLVDTRLQIIFIMFDLIGRVDKTVRQTAYQCLKQLLSKQEHPKDLIQNDQKLKHILRPVLISLQLQFKRFTPSFLHMFKKILKLLTQCFNITLIQKLVDKLREMQKTKELQASSQTKTLPQQTTKHLNYSEITLQTKCIANFLALFQHLAYAYHNHRSANYTVNSIILIFKYVGSICNYFTPKLGKHTIRIHIKTVLARVLNTMCEKLSGESIFVDGQQRQLDLQNFLQLINLDESFPLREKLTRQTTYIDKALAEFCKNKGKKDYLVFLEIVYVLSKRNNRWLKGFNTLGERLIKELNEAVQSKYNVKFDEKKEIENNEKNQIIILSKILLQYIKQNTEDLRALFTLVSVFKLRSTLNLHFIRKYMKYDLYECTSPQIKKQIFLQFLSMLKAQQSNDAQRIIAISQNIIYYFILIEVNKEEKDRQILIQDQQLLKSFADTIKICLNPKILHNKGVSQANFRHSANNYRIAIEILQISNLSLSALKNILSQYCRNAMLLTVWGLLRIQDKIIKNYAFVWTSNYIRNFQGFDSNKALGLYLTLIRGLESLSQGDYQIGALIKKALNILIPYWDARSRNPANNSTSWIDWSLKAVHEENNEPNKLVRFWEIVVKNHKIFHKFKSKFETQMVNSMQWLMVANNPTSTNPLVKKIASDMSFIYIEWKFKEAKTKFLQSTPQNKVSILQDSLNDRAAEICLNFFIKVALNNSNDKDDKQIMKRSLYLLKKTLILWPNTKKKFETIRNIVNKLKGTNPNSSIQGNEMPLRFHYTLLNIINILLLYEQDSKLVPQLTSIFKLLELGSHITPPRFSATNPHTQQTGTTIFTMNNIYLLNLLCTIVKRLVTVAFANEREEESSKLIQEIHQYIRDGFQFHALAGNRGKINGPQQQARPNQNMKKIQIEVSICFLKILYDIDPKSIDTHLNYIKQVTSSLKKMFQKGFETSSKNNAPNRVYELPALVQGSFQEMLQKNLQIKIQLIKPQSIMSAEQNYEKDNIKSYATRRPLFVILLRILAAKFNFIGHSEDQANILDIFLSIYEKIPDPELKIQVINILKCMFIGKKAFNSEIIPDRYKEISIINYPIRKLFYLLFEDSNKFNEHFERRKSKPSDQNYNINERIYQEITTKIYFNFLCQFIISLPSEELNYNFLQKIKIFVLFAVKVADGDLLDIILEIIDRAYSKSSLDLYVNLFQDYKELNCAQQNLQGDQISLFFTFYLYKKLLANYQTSVQAFQKTLPPDFHKHFLNFLKSDVYSLHHSSGLQKTLKISIKLLPYSKNLQKALTQYLIYGNFNDSWGAIILKVALELNCLQPEQLYMVASNINQYGLLLKYLEQAKINLAHPIIDFVYRAYGDKDLIYGFRMVMAKSSQLRLSLLNIQQRNYVKTLESLNTFAQERQSNNLKRSYREFQDQKEQVQQFCSIQKAMQESLVSDLANQCFKNLNQWDDIINVKQGGDQYSCMEYLFHSNGNKDKINSVLQQLDRINQKQFPYYYGKSVINFMESNTTQNKQLNLSLLFALLEWLSYPKNSMHNQNRLLVKIECLLQLEEGEKIKEESLTSSNSEQLSLVQALTKVVQSVYTQINSWRERMPDKNENLSVWNSILGQRVMIYQFMKTKMIHLLDNVMKNQNQVPFTVTGTEKLLIPYTDIEWNKLKLIKQERQYQIYNQYHLSQANLQNLYLDENLIYQKEYFYYYLRHKKDHPKAIQIIQHFLKESKDAPNKDEELFKSQKLQIARLKSKIFVENGFIEHASCLFNEVTKGNQQHLLPLWRDWMVICIKGYQTTKRIQWAQMVIITLPYALRYKTHKTKLIIAPVFQIISSLQGTQHLVEPLSKIMEVIPIKPLMFWLPELLRLSENQHKSQLPNSNNYIFRILEKLSICYTQTMYYCIKYLFRNPQNNKMAREIFLSMKKIYYNLITKIQGFSQIMIEFSKADKIQTQSLGVLSRSLAELHIPLYENWRGELEIHNIPLISQFSEEFQRQSLNSRLFNVITLLGADGKQYKYRLQKLQKEKEGSSSNEYQSMLITQTLQMFNNQLSIWKESSIRKLSILEDRKLTFFFNHQQARLVKSNCYKITPQDILSEHQLKYLGLPDNYHEIVYQQELVANNKSEANARTNKKMKEIIPKNVLRQYLTNKSLNYDDFISFRRNFSYQYGALISLHYVLSIPLELQNYNIDLKTGNIMVYEFPLNYNPKKLSPFAIRLSTAFLDLFGQTYINAGVLPAFISSLDALHNSKLNFKAFLSLLYEELEKKTDKNLKKVKLFERISDVVQNYEKGLKVMQVGSKIGRSNTVGYNLKYWF